MNMNTSQRSKGRNGRGDAGSRQLEATLDGVSAISHRDDQDRSHDGVEELSKGMTGRHLQGANGYDKSTPKGRGKNASINASNHDRPREA